MTMSSKQVKVLFVCMGNICRSPTVEAVFEHAVKQAGLEDVIISDSVGTHDYHIGEPPDERAQQAARKRGYDMSKLRARQVETKDFERFDYILAMDRDNLALLERKCPSQYRNKLALFCDFDEGHTGQEVPDPYFGGSKGFEQVLDMAEQVSDSLLAHIKMDIRN
jgi:protein-tyrosine phosphatase